MIEKLFQPGEPMEHRGIVITPLFPRRDPVAAYITLDEALPRGLCVAETSEAGSVAELVVENPLTERVLLYDGEELVGGKQNRILNVSVLVEAMSGLTIPVSCVEQGRWRRQSVHFATAPHISHAELRRRKAESQAARPLARGVAQGEVWDAVRDKSVRMMVSFQTGRARTSTAPTSGTSARSRTPSRSSRASAGRSSRSAATCASTPCRDRCVRSPVAEAPGGLPARCARAPRRQADAARRRERFPRRDRQFADDATALGRARRGRAPARRARARVRARARRRADPVLRLPERRRRAAGLRSHARPSRRS
jgi:hypothetical protein